MGFDVFFLLIALAVFWLGWSLRIYIDWIRAGWILLISWVLIAMFPYFSRFVRNSSVNIDPLFFYGVAAIIILVIFVSVNLRLKERSRQNDFLKRLTGSFIFSFVALSSFILLVLVSLKEGWIPVKNSILLGLLSGWVEVKMNWKI